MHFEAKKSLGQNFLNNPTVPRLMADAAAITNTDTVLEIGPGTGVLTKELLSRARTVIALETDPRAVALLTQTFAEPIQNGTLILVEGDARTLDLSTLPIKAGEYKVVANIPYYLSGFLFRTFLEHRVQPSDMVFLVQKEVAERITRDPKESLLSLSVKAYGEPRYIKTVKKGNFTPQPKIDSAIIAITDISKKRLNGVPESDFFALIHAGFKSRRKQLLGNLSDTYERVRLIEIFEALGMPLTIRAEDIPLPRWIELIQQLASPKPSPRNTLS